jgi:glutathione S-transferase
MVDFIVHSMPGSPYNRTVLATLEEKGAAWRLAPVTPEGTKAEAHLGRHPFGKVPALQQGEFILYETQAIVRYLDRVLPSPPLTPENPRAAARMDQAMGVNDWYLYLGCGAVIGFERVVKPLLLDMPSDIEAIHQALPAAHRVFEVLSGQLDAQPYLAGDGFSLADLMVGPQLEILSRTPEWATLTEGRGNLVDYLDRLERRPSFIATKWERLLERLEAA